jgi:hypothetical protein
VCSRIDCATAAGLFYCPVVVTVLHSAAAGVGAPARQHASRRDQITFLPPCGCSVLGAIPRAVHPAHLTPWFVSDKDT